MLKEISSLKLNPISKYEFERLLSGNIEELMERFSKSKEEIMKMADIVLEAIKHAEYQIERKEHINEWTSIRKIWNVSGFILLASLDLKVFMELLCISKDSMQRIAITRMIYTQLYEISRSLDDLTNIRYVEEIKKIQASRYVNELYDKRKVLSELRKKYERELYKVRVNVGAHREEDYQIFHDYICSMEYTASMQLVFMFSNAIDDLGETIQKIMNQSAEYIKYIYEGK